MQRVPKLASRLGLRPLTAMLGSICRRIAAARGEHLIQIAPPYSHPPRSNTDCRKLPAVDPVPNGLLVELQQLRDFANRKQLIPVNRLRRSQSRCSLEVDLGHPSDVAVPTGQPEGLARPGRRSNLER